MRTLRKIIAGILIGASLLFSPIKNFADTEGIFDKTYSVPLYDDNKYTEDEFLRVTAKLDEEKNTLYLGNYTENYNTPTSSPSEKTFLNPAFSKTIVIHPPEIKIPRQEQKIYRISFLDKGYWDENLIKEEEHGGVQLISKSIEKFLGYTIDSIISLSGIPTQGVGESLIKKDLEYQKEQQKKFYEELASKIKEGYIFTVIKPEIPKNIFKFAGVETARESKIRFDMSEAEGEVPIFLLQNIVLGNPGSQLGDINPIQKNYGKLENIVIGFSLEGSKEIPQVVRHKPTGIEFVLISPGTFKIGAPSHMELRESEGLRSRITSINKPYYISRYEITQKQFEEVMKRNPSKYKGQDIPVHWVTWNDATEFCKKAGVRLPTEKEWEYACRARTQSLYFFGNKESANVKLDDYAWYSINAKGRPHKVGLKKPNKWGIYDIYGNVAEWCSNEWPGRNPWVYENPSDFHTIKGGSWKNNQIKCSSAFVECGYPQRIFQPLDIGFRVVMDPKQITD